MQNKWRKNPKFKDDFFLIDGKYWARIVKNSYPTKHWQYLAGFGKNSDGLKYTGSCSSKKAAFLLAESAMIKEKLDRIDYSSTE